MAYELIAFVLATFIHGGIISNKKLLNEEEL